MSKSKKPTAARSTRSLTAHLPEYYEEPPSFSEWAAGGWSRAVRSFTRDWATIFGYGHHEAKSDTLTSPSALGGITMMLAFILPVTAFFCWIVASLNYSFGFEIHDFMSLATGVLLVFRLETAYTRYFEARKHLARAQTSVQSIALVVITQFHRHYGDPETKITQAIDDVRRYLLLWFWSMVNQLDQRDLRQPNIENLITESELKALTKSRAAAPATCIKWIGSRLAQLEELGYMSPLQLHETTEGLEHLNEALTELEKIANTPQPFGIRQMTTGLAVFFVYTAPFALATDFAARFDSFNNILARTLLSSFLLGIVYFAVNLTSLSLEDPLSPRKNEHSLPLDSIVRSVEFELNSLFTDPIPPVVGSGANDPDNDKASKGSDILIGRGGQQAPIMMKSS
jgi:predicted membrane chloride channel (bestrophin family)